MCKCLHNIVLLFLSFLARYCFGQSVLVTREDIERNYQAWEESMIQCYDITFAWSCFCIQCYVFPKNVQVREGIITSVQYANEKDASNCGNEFLDTSYYSTINDLFVRLLDHVDTADATYAEFDSQYYYPISAFIDIDFRLADEEISWYITSFDQCLGMSETTAEPECSECITVSSIAASSWQDVDTTVYLGQYCYSGYDFSNPNGVNRYPIYTHEKGHGSITVRQFRRTTDLAFLYRFYDVNDNSLLRTFWGVGENPQYLIDSNNNPYIDISNGNPFDGDSYNWLSYGYPGRIGVVSELNDECQQLGFDE